MFGCLKNYKTYNETPTKEEIMEWSRVLKNRTIENALMQIVVDLVFMTGYIAVDVIRQRREDRRLDQYRQDKKYS